jgi:hypothetical protein
LNREDDTMKVTMTIRPAYDNEIRFFDACKAAAQVLTELADRALQEGDCEQFVGLSFEVIEDTEDAECVGAILVSD